MENLYNVLKINENCNLECFYYLVVQQYSKPIEVLPINRATYT